MSLGRLLLIAGIVTLASVMLFVSVVPQSQSYHAFADQREVIRGVPNTWNTLSNIPFLIAGAAGLLLTSRAAFRTGHERVATWVFFAGTFLTGIGSSVYHLHPNDRTLVYDRLGMIVAFTAFLAVVVLSRIDVGWWFVPALLAVGIVSIVCWRVTGDLRFYGWVQFFPFVAIALTLWRAPSPYSGERVLMISIVAAYTAAKLFELGDRLVYDATSRIVSGHTLKHVAASIAPVLAARWIGTRTSLDGGAT